MDRIPIGLQLYTVRDQCEKDFVGTLEQVAEIGFEGVELAGLYSHSPGEVRDMLTDLDLEIVGNHMSGERDLDKIIDVNQELGCDLVWGPCIPEGGFPENEKECEEMVEYANGVGRELKKAGIQLYYHNHSKEFNQVGGRYIMDWLLQDVDPDNLVAEIDVMWVQYAGVDPAPYIRQYPGRVPLTHIKDMDQEREFTPVGQGVLDFDPIFDACQEVGTEWYIVEQDRCEMPSIESARISFDFFKEKGMV